MSQDRDEGVRARWARLKLSIIGQLLVSPPEHGELAAELNRLAAKEYRHPTTGECIRFGRSTLERWLYIARHAPDSPFEALARKVHSHTGTHPSMGAVLREALRVQYRQHPTWTYQLHHDNLVAQARKDPSLGEVPSVTSVARFMKAHGLLKRKRRRRGRHVDPESAFERRETRSYEVENVHALWHADFHEGSRRVLTPGGEWVTPILFGVLDDRSRLCCHLQWYLAESAETFVHGMVQALLKRGLPRSLLTDNGSAMLAAESAEGLERLGILHDTTLPYCPEQNAKQEAFWGPVEGRLLPMLEGEKALTLELLNTATQAWVEMEYNRHHHSELGTSPLDAFLNSQSVGRESPESDVVRRAFRRQVSRTQRRTDATITVEGVRFELPWRYRTLLRPTVRYARWDLSRVDLVDPHTGKALCELFPLDKRSNADGRRRVVDPIHADEPDEPPCGIAPHLELLMADYAATGMPPAYLPHDPRQEDES